MPLNPLLLALVLQANPTPPSTDPRIYDIIAAASPERIERDIRTLVGFGTRHTLSETESDSRGIFDYAAKLTAVIAASPASLAWAPAAPTEVEIEGAVRASATLSWKPGSTHRLAGYRFFGVAAVAEDGNESVVAFPKAARRR